MAERNNTSPQRRGKRGESRAAMERTSHSSDDKANPAAWMERRRSIVGEPSREDLSLSKSLVEGARFRAREKLSHEDRELLRAGQRQHTRETHVAGHEPLWMMTAKEHYRTLGMCLDIASHENAEVPYSSELREDAAKFLRRFVDRTAVRKIASAELRALMTTLDRLVARSGDHGKLVEHAGLINAAYLSVAVVNLELHRRLVDFDKEALAEILRRWADESSRKPSKWQLFAEMWNSLSGAQLDAKSVRAEYQKMKRDRKTDV